MGALEYPSGNPGEAAGGPAATGGPRILVMDDEPAVLAIVAEYLQYSGYRVDGVVNGAEAIAAYRQAMTAGDPYKMVILDLFIDAGMGGQETIAELRDIDPAVQAIISSGQAGNPLVVSYAAHGFVASLLKPYRLEHLEATLTKLLT